MTDNDWNDDYSLDVLNKAMEHDRANHLKFNERPQEVDEDLEIDGQKVKAVAREDREDIGMGAIVFYGDDAEELAVLTFQDYSHAPVPANMSDCIIHVCDNEDYWFNKSGGICDTCQEEYTFATPGRFGIIIPQETGVIWRQQTKGVRCSKAHIEGVFVPFRAPSYYDKENKEHVDLLSQLRDANYQHNSDRRNDIWSRIREELRWEFEEAEPPGEDYPRTQEALKWIRITDSNASYFHSTPNRDMEDKTVALVYPNCD